MTQLNPETLHYVEELSITIKALALSIENIENDLKKVKNTLNTLATLKDNIDSFDAIVQANKENQSKIQDPEGNMIEGEFDGYFMVGDDLKKYPVPVNYSSKSKLIPGDRLKVTIKENGELIYKLIIPAERKHVRAVLTKDEKDPSKFLAISSDKQTYNLNTAAVSFFKGLPGDEVYITINKE